MEPSYTFTNGGTAEVSNFRQGLIAEYYRSNREVNVLITEACRLGPSHCPGIRDQLITWIDRSNRCKKALYQRYGENYH